MRLSSFMSIAAALVVACSGSDPDPIAEPPLQEERPTPPSAPPPTEGGPGAPKPDAKPVAITLTTSSTSVMQATTVTLGLSIDDPDNVGVKEVVFRRKGVLFATVNTAPWSATQKLVNLDNGVLDYDAHVVDKLGRELDSNKVSVSVAIPTPPLTLTTSPATAILPGRVNVTASSTLAGSDIASIEVRHGVTTVCTAAGSSSCPAAHPVARKDNGTDVLEAKLVDKDGNVAVAKSLKVDIQPTAFREQFGGATADGATDVAVDPSGNVFIVGYALAELPNATGTGKVFVRKLDASGTVLWTKRYCTDCQWFPSAAIGANGGLVIGSLTGALDNMSASVLRLSADGTLLFRSDLAAPTTGFGEVQGVVEGGGGIYLLADSYVGTIADATGSGRCVVSRFDAATGMRTFVRRLACTMGWSDVFGPAWVGDGVVIAYNDSPQANVWGRPSLHEIDAAGNDLGRTPMDVANAHVTSFTRSGSELFVAFEEYDYAWEKFIPKARKIARYSASSLALAGSFTTDATISGLAPDSQGGVFGVTSYSTGLVRYSAAGSKLFTFANTVERWFAVAAGPGAVSWLVGRANGDWVRAAAGGVDAVYIGLSASGTPR